MDAKRNPELERAVRIELLLARSALERESLCRRCRDIRHSAASIGRSFGPVGMLTRLARGRAPNLLLQLGGLARRYPLLLSTVSAWLVGRQSRVFKAGSLAVAAWQLYRIWRKRHPADGKPPGQAQ